MEEVTLPRTISFVLPEHIFVAIHHFLLMVPSLSLPAKLFTICLMRDEYLRAFVPLGRLNYFFVVRRSHLSIEWA